jgi:WD40 repeat protein
MSAPADFFQVGGPLSDDAASYIERPADRELLFALDRGEICLVLAPRQTGKTSLMVHAIAHLNKKGIRAGFADLQPLGSQTDPIRWFSDVLYQIERSLKLKTDSGEWWVAHDRLGPTLRFMSFLEDVVLTEIKNNVVLFLDEIDSVLGLPFSDDFFTTIRSVYNARAMNPSLRRLTFVLLGLATASSFIRDRSRTPFNIGTSIALDDFDMGSTEPFRQVLGPESEPLVERTFYWTNGQPYLVQKLAATAFSWPPDQRSAEHIDEEVRQSYLQRQITQDTHLKFIQDYLLDDSTNVRQTLRTYRQVLQSKNVVENEQSPVQSRLKLAGVVRGENKRLVPRNRIYESVFNVPWVQEHIPRDVQKLITYSTAGTLALILLWMYVARPLLLPFFYLPDTPRIVKYTADPSVDIELLVSNVNVSRAFLDGREIVVPQNRVLLGTLGGLQVGKSTHTLRMVGGLFSETRDIPIEATYYPRWEVRQFPDAQLEKISPTLEIAGSNLNFRDVLNGNVLRTFEGDQGSITSAIISPDRKLLFSGREDGTLALWDTEKEQVLQTHFGRHNGAVLSVAFAPDGRVVITGSRDRTLKMWDIKTGQELRTFAGHSDAVDSVAFAPDGRTVLSGSADHTLKLWDIQTGAVSLTLAGHNGPIRSAAFSPDGRTVLSGSDDATMRLWNTMTGQNVRSFKTNSETVRRVAFSPDGQLIYWQSVTGALKVWYWNTSDRELPLFAGHEAGVFGVAFAPDGKTIVSGSIDETLKLWDVTTGQAVRTFAGHGAGVTGVAFAPDGKTVVSGSEDKTLKLWWVAVEPKS